MTISESHIRYNGLHKENPVYFINIQRHRHGKMSCPYNDLCVFCADFSICDA